MAFKVVFRPQAEADLTALYDYISHEAGIRVAGDFIARVEEACLSLAALPARGAPRDDIVPGLRIMAVERRTIVAFRVRGSVVTIARIFHGGRDWERWIRDDEA